MQNLGLELDPPHMEGQLREEVKKEHRLTDQPRFNPNFSCVTLSKLLNLPEPQVPHVSCLSGLAQSKWERAAVRCLKSGRAF